MGELLGPRFLLSSLTANIARPGGAPMYLHTDQGYVDFWTEKPLVANVLFMLDDFTERNGATRLVPGSHLNRELRRYAAEETDSGAEGPAGSVMVFDEPPDPRLLAPISATGRAAPRPSSPTAAARSCGQRENFCLGLDPARPPQQAAGVPGPARLRGLSGSAAPTPPAKPACSPRSTTRSPRSTPAAPPATRAGRWARARCGTWGKRSLPLACGGKCRRRARRQPRDARRWGDPPLRQIPRRPPPLRRTSRSCRFARLRHLPSPA